MRALALATIASLAQAGCGSKEPAPCRDAGAGCAPHDAAADPTEDASVGDASADAGDPRPEVDDNFVFVTSAEYSTRLGGLHGADAKCNERAAAAGLPGTYVAWLSTTSVDARGRLGGARGWVRTDGLPFADSLDDIVAGKILYPIALDELGGPVDHDEVLTGTRFDGTTAVGGDCDAWTSATNAGSFGAGSTASTSRTWTQNIADGCIDASGHLYCFGVDRSDPLDFTPATGRSAFAFTYFTPGGGLASGDDACQQAASDAGLTGQYAALLATSGASAASRFSADGPTWVRRDGVRLGETAADVLNGRLIAGLNVTADGEPLPAAYAWHVWTGADHVTLSGDRTCADWAGGSEGRAGEAGWLDGQFFRAANLSCDTPAALYCLEQ